MHQLFTNIFQLILYESFQIVNFQWTISNCSPILLSCFVGRGREGKLKRPRKLGKKQKDLFGKKRREIEKIPSFFHTFSLHHIPNKALMSQFKVWRRELNPKRYKGKWAKIWPRTCRPFTSTWSRTLWSFKFDMDPTDDPIPVERCIREINPGKRHSGRRCFAPDDPRFGLGRMLSAWGRGGIGSAHRGLDFQARKTYDPRHEIFPTEVCKGEEMEGGHVDHSIVFVGLGPTGRVWPIDEVPKGCSVL